jgi:hypothetical protein
MTRHLIPKEICTFLRRASNPRALCVASSRQGAVSTIPLIEQHPARHEASPALRIDGGLRKLGRDHRFSRAPP